MHIVGGRPDRSNDASASLQRRDRLEQAGKLDRGRDGQDRRDKDCGDLAAGEGRGQHPQARGRGDVKDGAQRQHEEVALDRNAENGHRYGGQDEEIDHADNDVGKLLAHQVFELAGRRDVEVDHRAQLLLAHDGHRHENRRDQEQQQRWNTGDNRVDALECGIVHEAVLDVGGVHLRGAGRQAGILEHRVLHADDVLPHGLAAKGICAIHLRQHLWRVAAAKVAAEVGRDLEDQRHVVRLQALECVVC